MSSETIECVIAQIHASVLPKVGLHNTAVCNAPCSQPVTEAATQRYSGAPTKLSSHGWQHSDALLNAVYTHISP